MFTALVLVGLEGTASAYSGLARYTTTGAPDNTFHGIGREVTGGYFDGGTSVVASGTKIYAGGAFLTSSGTYQLIVGRFNSSDGSVDTTFGFGGVTTAVYSQAQSSNREGLVDLAIDSSGRIVALCGSDTGNGSGTEFLVRFNANGTVDTTFGSQGFALPWSPTLSMVPVAVRVSPNGSIVLTDYEPSIEGPTMNVVSFSSTGQANWRVEVSFEGAPDTSHALAVDSSNRIVVTGGSGLGHQGVIRLLSNGNYDANFGSGGHVNINWGVNATGTGVAIDGSGRIVLTGNPLTGNTTAEILLARLSSTGVIDGSGGVFTVGGTTGSASDSWAIRVTPDGKYVVGGTTKINGSYQFMVTRFLGTNYTWDPGFGSVGTVFTAFPEAANAKGIGLSVDTSNRPVMIGTLF